MPNKSNLVQLKKSTFRKGMILLYAFFLSLIAFISTPQILTPEPGEKSLRCAAAQWYVGLARAAGQNCTTTCSNWEGADCSGYSSCYNKNISCINGRDQNGRSCQGCCFDCVVECTPVDEPPSVSASISCGQWGTNGWCREAAALQLTASDPQGYSLSITGNANSTSISCNEGCSVDLPVGSGVANFVATASQSGMSVSGNMNWNYDPESPGMNLNVNGSVGKNGWYISPVTVTSTGSDSISGLAGAFLSVNGGQWQTSATLGEGQHNVDITASDYAGNIVNSSTALYIDTTTPSINVNINGEANKRGWFASKIIISASASDSTSGIASVEYSMDGSPYLSYSSPVNFSGGSHTIQFRVTDHAGNTTETPKQEILVDLKKPTVNITSSDFADGIITYASHDGESGLASIYITVEDKDGKYPKLKWNRSVSGNNVAGEYRWNGKLDGSTTAPPGEYIIWIKAVDQAGNDETQTQSVTIPVSLSSLSASIFDTFKDDQSSSSSDVPEDEEDEWTNSHHLTFGGVTTEASDSINKTLSVSADAPSVPENPFPWGQILGPITIAAGAATFVATRTKRQRNEELRAETSARIQAEREAARKAKARANEASKKKMLSLKTERIEAQEEIQWEKAVVARQKALEQAQKNAQVQAGLEAYYNARKQGEMEAAASAPPKERSWWEKAIDYVDQHQVEIALGVGVVVGIGVIFLSAGTAAPLIAWVAGAAIAAGGTIAVETVALNSYYERDWNENLGRNILLAGIAAAAVSGAWFLLQGAVSSIGAYCAVNTNICARVEPILNALDKVEEGGLNIKLAYQTWRGDPNAADTALELQMEHMDGGMPGNSTAREIADLGEDAAELISLYGDDAIPLLLKYGDDAVDIIGAYGDDGIKILQKYGRDSIDLILDYGTPAMKVMEAVNPNTAKKLLDSLDDDVLDYAMQQGPDAIAALSHWTDDELIKYGEELALRAKNDAKALDAASKLAKIKDLKSPEAKELLKIIAQNSIQGDGSRIVLGKWVEGNLDAGFIGTARSSGSYFYGPNPGLANAFKEVDPAILDEYLWAVNQQALQEAIDSDMIIDYSFDGLPLNDISTEISAIEAITKGASKSEVEKIMKRSFPFRMREIQYLVDQGYTMILDETDEIIHWVKP